IKSYYQNPTAPNMSGDEFITPSVICDRVNIGSAEPIRPIADSRGALVPRAVVKNGDSIIFYNYRGDRPRELTKAFIQADFTGFDRGPKLDVFFTTMSAYEQGLPVHVAYPKPPKMANIVGELLSNMKLKQFRSAETEKFPHVT